MSLQVEGVIETLPTVGAEVPLDVVVTLHVTIQHTLVGEGLLADVAGEEVSTGAVPQGHLWVKTVFVTDIRELGLQDGRSGGHKRQPPGKRCPPQGPHLWAVGSQRSAVARLEGTFGSMASLLLGSQVPYQGHHHPAPSFLELGSQLTVETARFIVSNSTC